jgi:hypothetical protein
MIALGVGVKTMKYPTLLLALGSSMAICAADELPSPLEKRASLIKPTAEELRWQQIPWVTDLTKGQRLAQQERRPILLWVTGDDPFERC